MFVFVEVEVGIVEGGHHRLTHSLIDCGVRVGFGVGVGADVG